MEVRIAKDKITVIGEYFDAKQTLECGQVFRFKKTESGYYLISGREKCHIATEDNITAITTSNSGYFCNYFDLSRDYSKIIQALSQFPELKKGLEKGRGIHILKQDLFETIVSFIISANNNIPRIQGIIERLCTAYGDKMDDFYAFPTPEQLKDATAADYFRLGAGYRDKYLFNTVRAALDTDILQALPSLPYDSAVKKLLSLSGVGPKVADCIALFALNHTCCYPTDTWIIKADGAAGDTAENVRKRGMERYGRYAGFAQQYRFYAEREKLTREEFK